MHPKTVSARLLPYLPHPDTIRNRFECNFLYFVVVEKRRN